MHIEALETRQLMAAFTASSVAELISDMNAANAAGGSNTITLQSGTTFKLNAVDNATDGPTGLPVVAAGDDLTIIDNGDTIQRSTAKGTPAFRLFDVAAGASLSLSALTLSNGLANSDSGSAAGGAILGGAILSQGSLSLSSVTVQNCVAQGAVGRNVSALGGGIFSSGALTLSNSTLQNNQALGSDGFYSDSSPDGGAAYGGGLYIFAGTASLTNTNVSSNLARGGDGADGLHFRFFGNNAWTAGGKGGDAFGGGIYIGSGTVQITRTSITRNTATGGAAGNTHNGLTPPPPSVGQGGGLYIGPAAVVTLDSFTQANTSGNTASTSDNDIFGSFILLA